MSTTAFQSETILQKESRQFMEQFIWLCNALLNRVFDLRSNRAVLRMGYLLLLFFIGWFIISLRSFPLILWVQHIQDILLYLFNTAYSEKYIGNPFTKFFFFGLEAFTNFGTLQYLPIILGPFFIAWQCSAIYLADVFDLEDVSIARKFIIQVSLTGNNKSIRVTGGEILAEHLNSPIFRIGGPGKVIVDIDSVVLFEKPDGTPNIIGPTAKHPGGKATLDGFERLRHTIDLRDHHSEPLTVSGRSRDGIKISATDIKLVYSIFRDHTNQDSTKERPYPYTEDVVKNLVYSFPSKVIDQFKTAKSNSSPTFFGINNVLPIVRGELGPLISEHRLTEYVASFGLPEFEKALARELLIEENIKKVNPPDEDASHTRTVPPAPEFIHRTEITNLFSEIEENFVRKCRERGVELPWIGVGTWKAPVEIVPEKHLEAWKLSRENLSRGSETSLNDFEKESIQHKLITLIQDVPIVEYEKATATYDHKNAIRALLVAYRQQLIEAAELMHAKEEAVPLIIIQAIKHISDVLGYTDWHWVGNVQSENGKPSSDESPISQQVIKAAQSDTTEDELYANLVSMVGGDRAIADRLINFESSRFPNDSRAKLIERAIERLLRDRQ